MDKYISAIVPVYNVENYLRVCLDSIANQKIPFDEVVLVNDGSTDSSLEICKEYCRRYAYFILLNQQNMGLSAARNAGTKVATGKYVVYIDSDDYIRNNMVTHLLMSLKEENYDVLLYNAEIQYEEEGGEPADYFMRGSQFYGKAMRGIDYLMKSFPANYVVSACVAAYRRQFILDKDIRFQEGMYFEDNAFCLQIYIMAERVKCIEQVLYIRRYHGGTITSDKKGYRKQIDLIKMNEIIWNILVQSDLDIYFIIRFVAYYFIHTWNIISETNYHEAVKGEWNKMLAIFHDMWVEEYQSKVLDFEGMAALLLYYKESKKNEDIEAIERGFEIYLAKRLRSIPLSNPIKRVGIYGIGRHTEILLALYKKYVGKIESDIFFVVSQNTKKWNNYKGYGLISCDQLPNNTDCIVISSFVYQEDMCRMLSDYNFDPDKIIKLYKDDDFCDLILAAKIVGL